MKNLTATICLTLAVLLKGVRVVSLETGFNYETINDTQIFKQTSFLIFLTFSVTQSALSNSASKKSLPNKLIGEVLLNACNSKDPTDKGVSYGIVVGSNQKVQLLSAQGLIGNFHCVLGSGASKLYHLRDVIKKNLKKLLANKVYQSLHLYFFR